MNITSNKNISKMQNIKKLYKKDTKEMNQNSKEKIQQFHFFNSPPRVGRKTKNNNNNRNLWN